MSLHEHLGPVDSGVGDGTRRSAVGPRLRRIVRELTRTAEGRLGCVLVAFTVTVALIGPEVAPHGLNEVVGLPFQDPSSHDLLGTDFLGRDLVSRILDGGRVVLLVAVLSTALAYAVAVPWGMLAGYRRGAIDVVLVGVADVLLSFPAIVFVLVLLAAAGSHLSVVIVGIAITHIPRVTRITRVATIDLGKREFIEAAIARGERTARILRYDVLPNISSPLLADLGLRLTFSILLYSALAYLGLGQAPPAADWGLLVQENQIAITYQPAACLIPALMIALLAIGMGLVSDAVARSIGRSVERVA